MGIVITTVTTSTATLVHPQAVGTATSTHIRLYLMHMLTIPTCITVTRTLNPLPQRRVKSDI